MVETDPLSIRLAGRGDAEAVHAMITALAAATDDKRNVKSGPRDFVTYGFGTDPMFETVIAERDDNAVGLCLFFYSFSTWLGEPGIYVQDLYVSDGERGRGLGRELLRAAAERGRRRQASHMRLSVYAWNAAAKSFYTSLGMEHRDREDTYHLGGDAFLALVDSKK